MSGDKAIALRVPDLPPSRKGTPPQVQRAELRLYDPTPSKGAGAGKPGRLRGTLSFQFNPKEVTIAKTAKWERKTAKGAKKAGPPEFTGTEPCKLTMEMFFDASESHDTSVVRSVETLFSCCVPTDESIDKKQPSPPIVVLHWGEMTSFPAYVASVSAKYTLFTAGGTPIRAACSVALDELPNEPWRQNPTSGSRVVHRAHTMVAGDSLASVAWTEYGDPAQWRRLAEYNEVDDPLRLPTGTVLLVPALADLG